MTDYRPNLTLILLLYNKELTSLYRICTKHFLMKKCLHVSEITILTCILDFSMVAKLCKEPQPRKTKNKETKSPSSPTRSGIKQAMRLKCNTLIHYEAVKNKV